MTLNVKFSDLLLKRAKKLFSVGTIRAIEKAAIAQNDVDERLLMERAGIAAYACLQQHFPNAQCLAIICGQGNNAGDGYVLARLAHQQHMAVTIYHMGDIKELPPIARANAQACQQAGIHLVSTEHIVLTEFDVIVDAILGIGIKGEVRGQARELIDTINASNIPVFAIDIPSGIDADTGVVLAKAIHADATMTFIGTKRGLVTAAAVEYVGKLYLDDLQLASLVDGAIPSAQILEGGVLPELFCQRQRDAHKGMNGHVFIVGGNYGMAGAVRMAAEAALRVGAGLVSVATRPEHVGVVVSSRPEIMCYGCEQVADIEEVFARATVVVIGPGLGTDDWARQLWQMISSSQLPCICDASALHLLAEYPDKKKERWILTPHPKEAAMLLHSEVKTVQADRYQAAQDIVQRYDAVTVLKGSGSIVASHKHHPMVCTAGNPGMASAGMGDVLSGVIAGLVAQGYDAWLAAALGTLVHARAGDLAASEVGERGLIASDLIAQLPAIVN